MKKINCKEVLNFINNAVVAMKNSYLYKDQITKNSKNK